MMICCKLLAAAVTPVGSNFAYIHANKHFIHNSIVLCHNYNTLKYFPTLLLAFRIPPLGLLLIP